MVKAKASLGRRTKANRHHDLRDRCQTLNLTAQDDDDQFTLAVLYDVLFGSSERHAALRDDLYRAAYTSSKKALQ